MGVIPIERKDRYDDVLFIIKVFIGDPKTSVWVNMGHMFSKYFT